MDDLKGRLISQVNRTQARKLSVVYRGSSWAGTSWNRSAFASSFLLRDRDIRCR